MSHRFGEIRQVAYLVKDIEKAMRHWTGVLGIGPFFYVEKKTAHGSTYRGQPTSPASGHHRPIRILNLNAGKFGLIKQPDVISITDIYLR